MVQWTKEQRKVIELRDRNLLVSAAAGSGKTATLVERIIERISKGVSPCNIDELLVVTFTKAAASEMKERIGNAIEKLLLIEPSNTHLQQQQSLLHNAQIMTIDSFCLFVIRNYFHCIDLDPSFRIADEAELTLLKSDVMSEVLEEEYEQENEDFLEFVECYSGARTDEVLEEYVRRLFEFSMSYPWQKDWFRQAAAAFDAESIEELEKMPWMKELFSYLIMVLTDIKQINERARTICLEPNGPWMYEEALALDGILLQRLLEKTTYTELFEEMKALSFSVLSRKKDEGVLLEKREQVKAMRDLIKEQLLDIKKKFFFQEPEEMLEDLKQASSSVKVLIRLTEKFSERFSKCKEEKNILDFGDMEHFALKILTEQKEGKAVPTAAARELSIQYKEILIDEYQDSNLVQETILNSISRILDKQPNIFMVGDVKQSIYKFRQARPELFLEKYGSYTTKDSQYQKIDLHNNFRSRGQVLFGINRIFERIMQKNFGGIEYNEEAALHLGASYPSSEQLQEKLTGETEFRPELILMDADDEELIQEDEPKSRKERKQIEEYNKRELEALVAVKRIRELTDPNTGLLLSNGNEVRRCEYRDIVILLRTMTGWAETFVEVLGSQKIPAHAETQTGYFKTPEVTTMLNMLKILDNPKQDIPFVAVLYSPIVGLTSEELAQIRAPKRTVCLYEALKAYIESGINKELVQKLSEFLKLFLELRKEAFRLPVTALLHKIFDQTGYYYYVIAMPGGEQRKQNLDMLLKRAKTFEATSYHGLFQFIRYIGRLIEYQIDYGEAGMTAGQENAIRIMSIHKSKGLEFPVVFVCGMGKKFNQSDARAKLILHPDYGIGPEYIDYKQRTRTPTLLKRVLQQKGSMENLSEEQRILYVAMTRAKEKLILTGLVKRPKEVLKKWEESEKTKDGKLFFSTLSSASSYLDFVGPACVGIDEILIQTLTKEDLVLEEAKKVWKEELLKQKLFTKDGILEQKQLQEQFLNVLSYEYPFEKEAILPIKTSVSELRRGDLKEEEMEQFQSVIPEEFEPMIPAFLEGKPGSKPTDRGTIYHRVLECIDYRVLQNKQLKDSYSSIVEKELLRIQLEKKLTQEEIEAVSKPQIAKFLSSSLASRMSEAAKQKKLHRECQFVLGLPACEVKAEYEGDAILLIQGIIDAYFEEDEQIVLVDYKTDYVPKEESETDFFQKRYGGQLTQYAKALNRLLKKPIKEKLIYSFSLGKTISI